jgi:hypothetical protein
MKATAFCTLLFHVYVLAPDPLKVTAVPAHTVWFEPALTVGSAFTATCTWAVFVHPFASVPVTVYDCVVLGVNATPFCTLLFHVYVLAPDPLKVTAVPAHTVWFEPALTVGKAFTVTVVCAVFVHPFAAVPVTVYVVVAFGVKATALVTPLFHV